MLSSLVRRDTKAEIASAHASLGKWIVRHDDAIYGCIKDWARARVRLS
jgi:hypothetical protein